MNNVNCNMCYLAFLCKQFDDISFFRVVVSFVMSLFCCISKLCCFAIKAIDMFHTLQVN